MRKTIETFYSPADECWRNRIRDGDLLPNRYSDKDSAVRAGHDLASFLDGHHQVCEPVPVERARTEAAEQRRDRPRRR